MSKYTLDLEWYQPLLLATSGSIAVYLVVVGDVFLGVLLAAMIISGIAYRTHLYGWS